MNPIKSASAIFRKGSPSSKKDKEDSSDFKSFPTFRNPFRSSGTFSTNKETTRSSDNVPSSPQQPPVTKDGEAPDDDVFFDVDTSSGELEQSDEDLDYEALSRFKDAAPRSLNPAVLTKKDLHEAIASLPFGNAEELFFALRDLFKLSHLYHADWATLSVDTHLIHQVVDSIRRYEANGLQLNGDGVRLLYKVVSGGSHSNSINNITSNSCSSPRPLRPAGLQVLSEHGVIELLLRLTLEHTVRDVCIALLDAVVQQDVAVFAKTCDICESICALVRIVLFIPL
jgi:hypothetical protein